MGRHRMKNEYFPHDTNASSDQKIGVLELYAGSEGYAFYFKMLEMTYREGKPLCFPDDHSRLFFGVTLMKWDRGEAVERFNVLMDSCMTAGLFRRDSWEHGFRVESDGILERLSFIDDQRQRWRDSKRKERDNYAESLQQNKCPSGLPMDSNKSHRESVTKESKVKESKVKESKVKDTHIGSTELAGTNHQAADRVCVPGPYRGNGDGKETNTEKLIHVQEIRPGVYLKDGEQNQLQLDLQPGELEYWLDAVATYMRGHPNFKPPLGTHGDVIRSWREKKLEDGYKWLPHINGYRKGNTNKGREREEEIAAFLDGDKNEH